MPIKGLTERRQLPREGKIRLGIKKISPRTKREYPVATDYFVCPPEVQTVYGEKPKSLDVIIPVEDEELWASQYYRQYSRTRGLICKGDGETCRRMIDTKTGAIAGKETQTADWREGLACAGRECPDYKGKACQEVMNLQFILPRVPGLGVWQIDTGSIHSIMNINNCATMIRASTPNGRVSWMPLKLTLEPTEVVNPDDPEKRKKTVYCMHLRYDGNLESLLIDSDKPRLQLIVGRPSDDEAPDDRNLSTLTPEKTEEVIDKAETDIEDMWPGSVIEAEYKVEGTKKETPKSEPSGEAPQAVTSTKKAVKAEAKVIPPEEGKEPPKKTDPKVLKTIEQLVKALKTDFGMSIQEMWNALGIASWNDLVIPPAEAYKQVAEKKKNLNN